MTTETLDDVRIALERERKKLTRQEDAVRATKAMIALIEARIAIEEAKGEENYET
jgi:hypothetical protein